MPAGKIIRPYREVVKPAFGTPLNLLHPRLKKTEVLWKFAEGGGITIVNSMAKAPEVLFGQDTVGWVHAREGYAARLEDDNFLQVNPSPYDLTEGYTFAIRIKVDADIVTSNYSEPLAYGITNDVISFHWDHRDGFEGSWSHQNSGGTHQQLAYTGLVGGVWYDLVLTWDLVTLRSYLNGVPVAEVAETTVQTVAGAWQMPLTGGGQQQEEDMEVSEVRLLRRPWSPNETRSWTTRRHIESVITRYFSIIEGAAPAAVPTRMLLTGVGI